MRAILCSCLFVILLASISAKSARLKRQTSYNPNIRMDECFRIWKQDVERRMNNVQIFLESSLRALTSQAERKEKLDEVVNDQTWGYLRQAFSTETVSSSACSRELENTRQALEDSITNTMNKWMKMLEARASEMETAFQRFWRTIVQMFTGGN